ncbi:MAG: beta-galactosidase, partial [Candidatus Marinimicrobia bacterium]|nr:beta-galactosidase [Candidatus Neomarinimicrobiota bacterium]
MKKISISIVLLITLGFCREVQPFNNGWKFALENLSYSKAMKYTEWQSVSIPHTWNNKDAQSGEDYYAGTAWYKNNFVLNKELEGKRVYIRFQGVGQVADVYINGKLVGIHQGAYSAFCYDLTDNIKFGEENTLLIRANNEERPDIVPINHFLFMVFGGIYRPVDLIITNPIHITTTDFASSGIYINQENISKNQAKIIVQTKLDNNTDQKQKIVLKTTIHDREQNIVANSSKSIRLNPGHHQAIKQKILIDNPRLWHGRNDPYLYKLTVEIIQDGKIIDHVDEPLGLRSFVIDKEKGFILNGEPYRLYGVCRHQEWQDYGSALSDKQHQIDFDMMYEMGATSLRLAHYQQAEYVYDYSDTLGFIIWAEIPMVRKWMGPEGPNVTQQMTEMILQNYNHPSIFTWGMHNEVYANSEEDAQVTLTKELHRLSKELDPDRYTIATSGYGYLHRPMNYHG